MVPTNNQPRFAAALFDIDGTLLDSTEFVVGAFQHALAIHGCAPLTRPEIAALLGPALDECYRKVAPQLDPQRLCNTHRAWQRERMHLVQPFPQAVEVLARLQAAGMRLAAVTARSKISSLGTVANSGLGSFLEFTISAEDVRRTKPDPEALLLALDRLGVPPQQAVMVGDTHADILAGQAAGTATIGVTYGFHGPQLAQSHPDHLVDNIPALLPLLLG